jgi:hypothetical protein
MFQAKKKKNNNKGLKCETISELVGQKEKN